LLLAHLLGDFVFQLDWMVARKRQVWAAGLHVLVHLATMLVLVGPGRWVVLPQLVLLIIFHFALDKVKISLPTRRRRLSVLLFFIDQAVHVLSIWFVAQWIEGAAPAGLLPASSPLIVYLIGLLLVTYVWFITERFVVARDPQWLEEMRRQALGRMLLRSVLFLGWLALGQVTFNGGVIAGMLFVRLPRSYRRESLLIDLAVSLAGALFVLLAS